MSEDRDRAVYGVRPLPCVRDEHGASVMNFDVIDVHPRLTKKRQELREKLEKKRTYLRWFIRLVMTFLFIYQIRDLMTTTFFKLSPELQNSVIVQDIYSGKVVIYLLIPGFIFGGIAGILFHLYLKVRDWMTSRRG